MIMRLLPTRIALVLALSVIAPARWAGAAEVPYDLEAERYSTETLFSYDGCMDHRLMGNSGQPKVFKDHVYLAIIVHGRRPRILQVPLNGGDAKIGRLDPDFEIPEDSHQYFTLGIDPAGYVHLTGGMHGGDWKYWISARPEDVSAFERVGAGAQRPPGSGITYPHFSTDSAGNLFLQSRGSVPSFQKNRQGKIVHVGLLSTYDAQTRTWRMLGADIPEASGGTPGHPATVWGDNFENGAAGGGWYVNNRAAFESAPDNTLHFIFNILNYSPPTGNLRDSEGHSPGKDILYACSKDGGRTLQRTDGTKVEWPVCAEAGPHQPDVIYAAAPDYVVNGKAVSFKGLVGGQIQLDWKARPMIRARNTALRETVVFRLESGKWVAAPAKAFGQWRDNAGVLMSPTQNPGEVVRLWDETHVRTVKLGGAEIEKIDEDYLRDSGTMIYTTKAPRAGNTVINIIRTTIRRPDAPRVTAR